MTGRKVIYGLHGSGYPNNGSERFKAINTFYVSNTSNEERVNIIEEYDVAFVLVNNEIKQLELKYHIKYQDNQFVLYDCRNRKGQEL